MLVILSRMPDLKNLFVNNQAWSEKIRREKPDFFIALSRQQTPAQGAAHLALIQQDGEAALSL